MKKLMIGALIGLSAVSAHAIDLTITATCGASPNAIEQQACDLLTDEINTKLGGDLPDASIGDYGTGLANANNFAYKGMNSDYSDVFDLFVVKATGGIAVDGDTDKPETADGVGVGLSVSVGLNLDIIPVDKIGPIELSKLDLFVTYMDYDLDEEAKGTSFAGNISNFSIMARYQIIEGKEFLPGNLFNWGGLFLHTGFQKSSTEISLGQSFKDETAEIEVAGQGTVTAGLGNTNVNFAIKSDTLSIPLEVSTYIRAGYVFTLYGGAGLDIVTGSTDVDLTAGGTASVESGYLSDYSASILASESDSGDADVTNMRAFFGMQFNVPLMRVYVQANKGLGNNLIGANAGIKILW